MRSGDDEDRTKWRAIALASRVLKGLKPKEGSFMHFDTRFFRSGVLIGGAAFIYAGCAVHDDVGASSEAVTGDITFDPSCNATPTLDAGALPVPNADAPANVRRNVEIAASYMRTAIASPAFRECMTQTLDHLVLIGPSYYRFGQGPYYACASDPPTHSVDDVIAQVNSNLSPQITCNYADVSSSTGGEAYIGARDSTHEYLSLGSELYDLTRPTACAFDPDHGANCIDDHYLGASAGTLVHELMHTHSYNHVADYINNDTTLMVGQTVTLTNDDGTTYPYVLNAGDFCGITPTSTMHPAYGSGIPYEVGGCVYAVITQSAETGHMHDDCGASFAGFNMLDSVFPTADGGLPAMHCVADPYAGTYDYSANATGKAPVPPHAPTCEIYPPCNPSSRLSVNCTDANANDVYFEARVRPSEGGSGLWHPASGYSAANEYRACAESIFGKACSTPTLATTLCLPKPAHLKPIPWWKQSPRTITSHRARRVEKALGGAMMAMAVDATTAASFPELGKSSGDLAPEFAALGIGVLDPDVGLVYARGGSTGTLPTVRGTAFAMGITSDGMPHLFGIGGADKNDQPIAKLYDGKITIAGDSASASWTSVALSQERAHAAATNDADGATIYLFGGQDKQGPLGDLSSYDVAKGAWKTIGASVASARVDASLAVDSTTAYVFGGRDAKSNLLGDVIAIDLSTGKTKTLTTLAGRASAAIFVAGGNLYVFGGETANGTTDELDVVSLATGKITFAKNLGVAASDGSSLTVDDDGVLTVVPGMAPKASDPGGVFIGLPDALTYIAEP